MKANTETGELYGFKRARGKASQRSSSEGGNLDISCSDCAADAYHQLADGSNASKMKCQQDVLAASADGDVIVDFAIQSDMPLKTCDHVCSFRVSQVGARARGCHGQF